MGVKIRKRNGIWYVIVDHKNQRKSKAVGTKAAAEAVKVEIEKRLAAGDLGIFTANEKGSLFSAKTEKWLLYIQLRRKVNTHSVYESTMRLHLVPHFGTRMLPSITPRQCEDFASELATRKDGTGQPAFTQGTVGLIMNVLRTFFSWARRNGDIVSNPAASLGALPKSGKEGRKAKAMTAREAERFLAAVEDVAPSMSTFFVVAVRAGLRRGELLALRWGDVNLGESEESTDRYLMVRQTWSKRNMGTAKSGKTRRVDLSRQARRALAGLRDERLLAAMLAGKTDITDELVFPGKDGKPMTAETIGKRFMNPALAKAGLMKFTIHDLRHTYGSILVQRGVPLKYVSEQMGHSSIKVTADMYAHLEPGASVYLIDRIEAETATGPEKSAAQPQLHDFGTHRKNTEDIVPAELISGSSDRYYTSITYLQPETSSNKTNDLNELENSDAAEREQLRQNPQLSRNRREDS